MSTFYICDQRAHCQGSEFCGNICKHTAVLDHAKYDKHTDFKPLGKNLWEIERLEDVRSEQMEGRMAKEAGMV